MHIDIYNNSKHSSSNHSTTRSNTTPLNPSLTHSSIHTLVRRPLSLVLVLLLQPLTRMFLFDTRRRRLEGRKVNCIRLHQHLRHAADIRYQAVNHVEGQTLAHDDAQDFCLLFVGWERVVCGLLGGGVRGYG